MPRRNRRLRMIVALICVLIVVATVAHAIARSTGGDEYSAGLGAPTTMEATALATANSPFDTHLPAPVITAL